MNASALSAPQRLLLALIDHAFEEGWRNAEDFLQYFPPAEIIASLSTEEEVRVKLLTSTTGMHERLARRKSAQSATDDLQLALEEKTTTPSEVIGLFPTAVQVSCLANDKLWQFLVAVPFWTHKEPKEARQRAVDRLAFTIDAALAQGILTHRELFDGIGFDELAKALPKAELEQIVVRALEGGRTQASLTEDVLLDVVPLRTVIQYLDLAAIWQRVVLPSIAAPAGFISAASAPQTQQVAAPAAQATAQSAGRPKLETLPGDELFEVDAPGDDSPLKAVRERLKAIERCPRSEDLPLAVLASIESMYEDFKGADDDDERAEVMREAFPNETFLRIGVLSLIDLLDPSINIEDPTIRGAEIDALIKIVLFEERKRRPVLGLRACPLPRPQRTLAKVARWHLHRAGNLKPLRPQTTRPKSKCSEFTAC